MKINVGKIDRSIRIGVGAGLVIAAALGYLSMWAYLGLIPLATGIFRFCPAYLPFGLSTCEREENASTAETKE
jgi:hypothetical protein